MARFGSSSPVRTALLTTLTQMYGTVGMSERQAKKMATQMVDLCQDEVGPAQQSTAGDDILAAAARGEVEATSLIQDRLAEGVKEADIRWYWNMTKLERCVLEKVAENARLASFLDSIEKYGEENPGASQEEAANYAGHKVRLFHAMYGDPTDESITSGEDRPLYIELKDRVDKYIERWRRDPDTLKASIEKFSSFNALVRSAQRAGHL